MKEQRWWGAGWLAVLVGAMLAGASLGTAGCQGEAEEFPPIDVSRPDATGGSACEDAADHVMGLCASSACAGVNVSNCRQHLVSACEQDLRDADAVFKYMCRSNARSCDEALACTL